jgi:hypothetical protein
MMEQFFATLSQFNQILSLRAIQISDHPEDISGLMELVHRDAGSSVKPEVTPLVEDLLTNLLLLKAGDSVVLYEVSFLSNLGSSQLWFVWR